MLNNILITGGAGFIGANLTLRLIEKGYTVTILDNLSRQVHGQNPTNSFLFRSIADRVKFIHGDVRSRGTLEKSLAGQDAVIHLAAETGTGQSMYKVYKYTEVNVGGTALLLDILANKKNNVQKIILASSRAIYGEGRYYCSQDGDVYPKTRNEFDLLRGDFECRCPICGRQVNTLATTENSKIEPQSIYGISKYNQEQYCLISGRSLGIPVLVFRYQNVYGPGQSLSNPYTGILSIFSTRIKNKTDLNIFEDGKESRDFVYIDDVVEATISGLENKSTELKTYNVGSGKPVSVLQIAHTLVNLFKSEIRVNVTGNFRFGDIRHNYADLTRINHDLNFSPRFQFDDGIPHFINWVNTQMVTRDLFFKSISELKTRGLYKEVL